jgi:DNA-binding NarL/FixJ family response regulator
MQLLIVDDHAIVREGLKRALSQEGFDSINEADCVTAARAKISACAPDVAIIDINLPDGTGFELIRWIRTFSKSIGIVVLTLHQEVNYVVAAMNAGASAFVSKSEPIPILIAAIRHSAIAPLTFSANALDKVIQHSHSDLTAREFDLLAQLEKGMTTQEISELMFISQSTVKTHLASIYRKLEVNNRTAAVHAMHQRGLTR